MNKAKIKIELHPSGAASRVEVDGVDLTTLVAGVDVQAATDMPPVMRLRAVRGQFYQLTGEIEKQQIAVLPSVPYACAYAGGTFDLFHAGHVELFRRIREQVAGRLVVGLNTDEFAERYKRKPVMTLRERVDVVGACRYVSGVVVNTGNENSKPAIEASGANVIVHGDDWTGPALMAQMGLTSDWLNDRGIAMQYLSYTPSVSTGKLLARVTQALLQESKRAN